MLQAIIIAFSMYSKIPMPRIEWNEKNMRYSLMFFPYVGVVIGALLSGWHVLSNTLQFNENLFAAIAFVIPIMITGGIHMDGFCDTVDALSSNQTREKKLEILKDSNSGAFAIIKACVCCILYFAAYTQISETGIYIVAVGFVLSRSFSGLSVLHFKSAKNDGLASTFKKSASSKVTTTGLIGILLISVAVMVLISPMYGGVCILAAALTFVAYGIMANKQFGGVTGDLAGYFLVRCELAMIYAVIIIERVSVLWN